MPGFSSILETIKVRKPLWQTCSQTAGVLLLHTPGEPATNIAKFYEMARVMFVDLWEDATETPALERTIAPVVRGFWPAGSDSASSYTAGGPQASPASEGYLSARFPQAGAPPRPESTMRARCAPWAVTKRAAPCSNRRYKRIPIRQSLTSSWAASWPLY